MWISRGAHYLDLLTQTVKPWKSIVQRNGERFGHEDYHGRKHEEADGFSERKHEATGISYTISLAIHDCHYTMMLQLERQLQMQQAMRSRMMAQQLAMGREAFDWWAAFYATTGVLLTVG